MSKNVDDVWREMNQAMQDMLRQPAGAIPVSKVVPFNFFLAENKLIYVRFEVLTVREITVLEYE